MNENIKVNYNLYNNLYKGDLVYYNKKFNAHERYQALLLDELMKEVDKAGIKKIVDIGCGAGLKTCQLAQYFDEASVLGTDFAEEGINKANDYFKNIDNLDFKTENILGQEFKQKFDIVTAFEIVEHIEDWKKFINDITNLSNKYIILSFPVGKMRGYEKQIGHCRNFQKGEMENYLSKKGYRPLKLFYAGFPFYSPITRDFLDLTYNDRDHTSTRPINKTFHNSVYFLFKYFSFKNIGDQFIGVFIEKEEY